jgi:polysaccharide biosynthesis protein PelC
MTVDNGFQRSIISGPKRPNGLQAVLRNRNGGSMGALRRIIEAGLLVAILLLSGCATQGDVYHDQNMDFGAIQVVAVMPFANFARDNAAADRVRDVLINRLLSTGAFYVQPVGEVSRAIAKTEVANPSTPSPEEIVKLGTVLKTQALIVGVVKEYGEVRSGSTSANALSISAQMVETQTGKIVFSASSTRGGVGVRDRLIGGGGKPMENITEEAVDDIIGKLFR